MGKVILASAIVALTLLQESKAGSQFVGTWSGTWDGAGTGGFELTIENAADTALTCKVSVTGEPSYSATCKTLIFEGNKMTAKYDFPPDDRAEVHLAATFDGKSAAGTWVLREQGSSSDMASGGWKVTKK